MIQRWVLGAAVGALAVLLLVGNLSGVRSSPTRVVHPGDDLTALARENPGATFLLLAGEHDGFHLSEAATVRGLPGAEVDGEIVIEADDVTLADLVIRAAENAITAREVDGLLIDGVRVERAGLHGIELMQASGAIRDCVVRGLVSPYAQGIEIRNSNGRTPTLIERCHVSGGMEGIVSHVSRTLVRHNTVEGQSMRGIVITEMSEGIAEHNVVRRVTGAGLFCGDMSNCEVRHNRFESLRADARQIRSRSGQAIVAWYYSALRATDNDVSGSTATTPVDVYHGSVQTSRFPLAVWWHGWRGALSGIPLTAAFFAVLGLVVGGGVFAVRRLPSPAVRQDPSPRWRDGAWFVAAAYAVQSFHMVEHLVQVFQTYIASAEHRSGLLGMHADTEWVHFLYNLAVVAFIYLLWRAVRGGRTAVAPASVPAGILLGTLVLQGYHMAEHAVKLQQHLVLRIDPGPGILGGRLGLVWFHFAINAAVHAGLTVVLWRLWRSARSGEGAVPAFSAREAARPLHGLT